MAMTITPDHDTEFEIEASGRRRKITKFALAGVAVLGVGAALTSAAWSDNVFFGGNASTGTLDLVGSANGGATWQQGSDAGAAIQIPASAFSNIGPDIAVTHTLLVRNDGSLDVQLADAVLESSTGTLFGGAAGADITIGGWDDSVLSPTEVGAVDVTITGGSWTGSEYQGATGSLVIQVQGDTVASP